jgi:aryl-alcohol dehydrogenase-like predicted oxidoreductase
MTFGNEADEATSRAIVNRFLDAGGNFIDTADAYQRGVSEEIVGRALAERGRDRVIVATKGRVAMSDDPNDSGASRRHLVRAAEASLRRLGTDWIDLYQVHWPDPLTPLEETLSTLDDLVTQGKIRYAGLSNFSGSALQRAFLQCERYGWAPIVSHQPQYNLIHREIEHETLQLCRDNRVAVLPWSPLGGGILTGKYRSRDERPANSRLSGSDARSRDLTDRDRSQPGTSQSELDLAPTRSDVTDSRGSVVGTVGGQPGSRRLGARARARRGNRPGEPKDPAVPVLRLQDARHAARIGRPDGAARQ